MRKIRVATKRLNNICIIALVVVLMIIGLLPINIVSAKSRIIPNDESGIPDKNLYEAILYELDKKSGKQFREEELEEVYSLGDYFSGNNENKKIKSLKGIEKLVNLRGLDIPINGLSSLKGIENLTNLQNLRIRNGNLKNINEVKKLTKLKDLCLEDIELEDWTVVGNLTELTNLEISKCGLKDLKLISGLTKLEALNVNRNKLKSVSGIEKLTNLQELNLGYNKLETLLGIEKLTELQGLSVYNNKLKSLSGIEKLTGLQRLGVSNNELKNLSGIEKITELQELYASNNKLTNLNEIENLTKLSILDVSKNKITSLPSLKKHKKLNLEYSDFAYNKISEKVFKKNLPSHVPKWWINNQVLGQNFKKKLKVKKVKKIKSTTKKNTGVTEKKAKVVLMTSKGKKIETVKADKKGKFAFKKLDLKKYKGKKLKITAYLLHDDQINSERWYVAVKTVKFKVRKK